MKKSNTLTVGTVTHKPLVVGSNPKLFPTNTQFSAKVSIFPQMSVASLLVAQALG